MAHLANAYRSEQAMKCLREARKTNSVQLHLRRTGFRTVATLHNVACGTGKVYADGDQLAFLPVRQVLHRP